MFVIISLRVQNKSSSSAKIARNPPITEVVNTAMELYDRNALFRPDKSLPVNSWVNLGKTAIPIDYVKIVVRILRLYTLL